MENSAAITINSEVQAICSKFHFGWIPKSEVDLERNYTLYRQVVQALSVMGYELITTPHWYVIRLLKEYDCDAFDQFHKRYRDINRSHLAMINILFVKLILPTKMKAIMDDSVNMTLSVTLDELIYNYGAKFQTRRAHPKKRITDILAVLKKYGYVVQPHSHSMTYQAGPALYMLREDLLDKTYEAVMRGFVEELQETLEEEQEDDVEDEA